MSHVYDCFCFCGCLVVSQNDAQHSTLPNRRGMSPSSANHANALATQLGSCHSMDVSSGKGNTGGTQRCKGCAASSCLWGPDLPPTGLG